MVHRALLGSVERFVGILTEHYAGAFPVWLSPVQAVVLPVTSDVAGYAGEVKEKLVRSGIRAEVDSREEKIGYRIRESEIHKVPYMVIVGKREAEDGTVSVRERSRGDRGAMRPEDLAREIVDAVAARR